MIPPGLQGFDPKSTIILQFAPYLIPFKTRVEIFQLLIHRDRSLVRSRNVNSFGVSVPTMVGCRVGSRLFLFFFSFLFGLFVCLLKHTSFPDISLNLAVEMGNPYVCVVYV